MVKLELFNNKLYKDVVNWQKYWLRLKFNDLLEEEN